MATGAWRKAGGVEHGVELRAVPGLSVIAHTTGPDGAEHGVARPTSVIGPLSALTPGAEPGGQVLGDIPAEPAEPRNVAVRALLRDRRW